MDVFATYWQRLTRIVGWDDGMMPGFLVEEGMGLATARPSCLASDHKNKFDLIWFDLHPHCYAFNYTNQTIFCIQTKWRK